MSRRSRKRPKARREPEYDKAPRTNPSTEPSYNERETIVWRFSIVDQEGDWGWRRVAGQDWWDDIFPKLQQFESMTWVELMQTSGGRSSGNNHHPVTVERLTSRAKRRLRDLGQDDVETLFSLRLDGTRRIYGIRDRRALKLLWYDKFHGQDSMAVYSVNPK